MNDELHFHDPDRLLWLLALLPLLAYAGWAVARATRRRERLLGGLAAALCPGFSSARRLLRDGLLLLAVGLVIVAWAGPLFGTRVREVTRRGVDVMIVLDTSRSMLADDVRPNRLARAKREVRGLLDRLGGDRVGLVTFAGDARRIVPLTHDAATFALFLDDVDTFSNRTGGTAIGEGLEVALDSFDEDYPAEAVIVLLTDGEDHASDPPAREVAYQARAREIPIHVVAFGTEEGGTIRVPDGRRGSFALTDENGDVVVSRPDEDALREIADVGNGAFLSSERTAFPLDELYEKRIAVMRGEERKSRQAEESIERYQWPLALALVALGVRALCTDRSRPRAVVGGPVA